MNKTLKQNNTDKIKRRIRQKVHGTSERPRLSVFRSNNHIYAQLIDDVAKKTLLSSSTLDKTLLKEGQVTSTCEAAIIVGHSIAKKSLEAQINTVVFDRGGKIYHGRVKALAEAAREMGLQF
jgi:large subunit ribosomal protein L18